MPLCAVSWCFCHDTAALRQKRCGMLSHLEPVLSELLQQPPVRPLLLCWPCIGQACQHNGHTGRLILRHKLLDCQVLLGQRQTDKCRRGGRHVLLLLADRLAWAL